MTKTNKISIIGMDEKEIVNLLRDKLSNMMYTTEDGGFEIYLDPYGELFCELDMFDILSSDNPIEVFDDKLDWMLSDNYCWNRDYIDSEIDRHLGDLLDEESYENVIYSDIFDLISTHFYPYYDNEVFLDQTVRMNILIDSDNWNYDCTCDNALNRYGCGEVDDSSSVLWLCKQLGKERELLDAIKRYNENSETKCEDCFIQSCIEELEEQYSSTSTLTFLVETTLKDAMKLLEIQKEESKGYVEYYPSKSKGDSYITVDKTTWCGLYDFIGGCGSLLGIKLPADVKLPIKNCKFEFEGNCSSQGVYGYTVDNTYGFIREVWKDNIKEIYDGTTQATK